MKPRAISLGRLTLSALLIAVPLVAGCSSCKDEPKSTRWEDAAAQATATAASSASTAPAASVVPAGALNRFFPKDGSGGYKRVFTADKEGYAEAKLQKDGKDVATISINDGLKPFAKAKFDEATEKLEGFPIVKLGDNQTSALVKERFQVKVTSSSLDHETRKQILQSFDLKGLASS